MYPFFTLLSKIVGSGQKWQFKDENKNEKVNGFPFHSLLLLCVEIDQNDTIAIRYTSLCRRIHLHESCIDRYRWGNPEDRF